MKTSELQRVLRCLFDYSREGGYRSSSCAMSVLSREAYYWFGTRAKTFGLLQSARCGLSCNSCRCLPAGPFLAAAARQQRLIIRAAGMCLSVTVTTVPSPIKLLPASRNQTAGSPSPTCEKLARTIVVVMWW